MADIVIKSTLSGHFTIIANEFARNPAVTPRAARVFIYLMSNTEGWITSAERISKILGMGTGAVGGALRDLESLGYLKRERKNMDGGRFKWEYELYATPIAIDGKPSNGATSEDGTNSQVGAIEHFSTDGSSTDGKATSLRRSISKNTKDKKTIEDISPNGDVSESSSNSPKSDRNDYPDAFNEFWFTYPKAGRNAKKAAFKAWQKAIKSTDPSVILSGAKRYADDPNRSDAYTKWAQGWLNDGRWDDVQQPAQNTAQDGRGGPNNSPVGYRPITSQERSILEFEAMKSDYHPMVDQILTSGMIPRNFNLGNNNTNSAVGDGAELSIGA